LGGAVAISDSYVVQYLLQESSGAHPRVVWREQPSDGAGFVTLSGEVQIDLENTCSRAGSYLLLRFRHADDEFIIREPAGRGWFARKFANEEDRCLASIIRNLMRAAAQQCSRRHLNAIENAEQARNRVYLQLLFGQSASGNE